MKVILFSDIKGVGKRLDIKEVPDGFARNFLIPKNLAGPATLEAQKNAQKIKFEKEKENQELAGNLKRIVKELAEKKIRFFLKADEHGKLFGSVSKDMILKALRENKFIIKEHAEIKMEHPLKEIGDYEIEIYLQKGIKSKLKISIERSPK